MAHKWGDAADDVPAGYRAQVEWQMLATGVETVDLVPWINGWDGPEVRTYRFTADPQLQAMLLAIGRKFWQCVVEGREPPVDGSESWKNYLAAKYPKNRGDLVPSAPEHETLASEILSLSSESKRIESRMEILENQMREAIGEHDGIEGDGWRATWKAPAAGTPAWKAIAAALGAEAHPEIIAANTAPPGRRFLLNAVKAKRK
mgnify:FL=1